MSASSLAMKNELRHSRLGGSRSCKFEALVLTKLTYALINSSFSQVPGRKRRNESFDTV